MSEFLVEVYVPRPAQGAAAPQLVDVSDSPGPVHLLRSIFLPEDETCFYLFEGDSGEAVREAATNLGLQVERVVAAVSEPGVRT